MQLKNDNGLGLLQIKRFEIGDYLYSDKLHVIAWSDCQGSVGKYVSLINETAEAKERIASILTEKLNAGNEIDLSAVSDELESFCTIFPKGKLQICKYKESDYSPDKPANAQLKFHDWSIVTPSRTDKRKEEEEEDRFLNYFEEKLNTIGWVPGNIIDVTTTGFYDAFECCLIFTQNAEDLNVETIRRYESEIKRGKRPYCVIYNSAISDRDNNYVLDGHHKLMAYHNLKIRPSILEITQVTEENSGPVDADRLGADIFDSLYTWQLKHIFDKGLAPNPSINQILGSSQNPFNQFVKNGLVEEYWVRGKLKSKGVYKDNKPDGIIENFYENGNRKSILAFKEGEQLGFIKSWFNTGELESERISNDDDPIWEHISYYKTGEINTRTLYKDGMVADGKSVIGYTVDGKISYVGEYKNGINIRSKWFDAAGNVTGQRGA